MQYVKNVLVEAGVLRVDGRGLRVVGDLVPADLLAVLRVELGELHRLAALRGVELGLLGEVVDLQVVRQVLEQADRVVRREARDGDGRGDHRRDQHAGDGAHAEDARERGGDAAGRVLGSRHRLQSTGRVYGNP
jgi:hypothetical protein